MPPFSVVCSKCAPKDLSFLMENDSLLRQKLFNWAIDVKRRDKYRCVICTALGITKKDKVTAHHIFPRDLFPELQFLIENGMTLCYKHHELLHSEQFKRIKEVVLGSNKKPINGQTSEQTDEVGLNHL